MTYAYIGSPTFSLVTFAPAFSTTPAMSYPGISGNVVPKNLAYFPERIRASTGFTPAAIIRTRTSLSFGSGRGTSSYFKTSGPPYSCTTMAFIVGLAVCASDVPANVSTKIGRIDSLKVFILVQNEITTQRPKTIGCRFLIQLFAFVETFR